MAGKQNPQIEMKAHEGTYAGFLTFFKVGSIVTAAVTALVVILISN